MPIRDESFQNPEKINNNVYKVDLPGKYGVNATFNIFHLFLFDKGDNSRLNTFKKIKGDATQTTPNDQL